MGEAPLTARSAECAFTVLHAERRSAAQEPVAEYEREYGELPEEARRRAREFMVEEGLLDTQV
jgi:hypothetical protein